ncbi:hypothetical protein [Sphingobacterium siyangense]|uniref:hypothetical protein n=1 Tax=Sphingobacterium siyangense TaxID=459529 RepID=UPI0019628A2E|nr:hypothetical protein [Sphingobacterium siyangense]QRY55975.1 hypothetical protein JVX97_18320 [Sphingobacterium siyangense]
MIPDKLDFKLPDFNRISWVSEELRSKWESTIETLPKVIDSVFLHREITDAVPIQIKSVSANDIFDYKKKIYSIGLFAEQLTELPKSILFYFGLKEKEAGYYYIIIGLRSHVLSFMRGIKDSNLELIADYLHHETFKYWRDYATHQLLDSTWSFFTEIDMKEGKLIAQDNTLLNPCWRNCGISSVPYNPALLDCGYGLQVASAIQSVAKKNLQELHNAWYELLSWPVEWSALHGIAEVKTPIFKMVYNTDTTAGKYTLQLQSDTYPENGLRGLLFPYKKPKKLYYTESKHAAAGVQHLEDTL